MNLHDHCLELFEHVSELIDGELDGITGQKVLEHIGSCPYCRVCFATFKKSVEVFQNLGSAQVPPDFLIELKAFIDEAVNRI